MTTVSTQNQVSQDLLNSVNKRTSTSDSVSDIQDRFMTLLITQMKNQDPLNPMDNAQVTSQMAQLSTVTGINTLNDTMDSLIGSVQLGQTYQATNMIGHSVLVEGNSISTSGSGGYFGVELPNGASSVTVNIKNGSGQTVRTLTYDTQKAGNMLEKWDGLTDSGSTAASGTYTFSVSAKLSGSSTTSTALAVADVSSVTNNSNGNIKLNLSNGSSVSISDIIETF